MLPSTKSPVRRSKSSDSAGSGWSGAITTFAKLIMSLSNGWRALVLIAIAAITGGLVYEKYVVPNSDVPAKGASHSADPWVAGAPYATGGIPDPGHPGADNANPQNVEAADKSSEDSLALTWHFVHKSEDDPEEIAIDPERQVFYRYFVKSDHCVFVRRRTGDSDQTQWVRDPNFHSHDVHTQSRHAALDPRPSAPNTAHTILASWLAVFFPVLQASATEPAGRPSGTGQSQGTCLNPHPGQFRYWWGAPHDQCNSPMYRQFTDGCTHYQLYNRCANAWDSRITWTKCVAQHSR